MSKKLKIKNYTSGVPVDRSISLIEQILVDLGAERIHKMYKGGQLESLSFSIAINGNIIPFRLPAQVNKIETMFNNRYGKGVKVTEQMRKANRAQAERTAWKLIHEWIHIQASMIRLEQAEFLEIFLPYVYKENQQKTFYAALKDSNYKALLGS